MMNTSGNALFVQMEQFKRNMVRILVLNVLLDLFLLCGKQNVFFINNWMKNDVYQWLKWIIIFECFQEWIRVRQFAGVFRILQVFLESVTCKMFVAILETPANCRTRNNSAQIFYRKMGFEVVRTEDNHIGNGFYMNDYVMELIL